jgi:fumarate hydratase subunit alpha
MRIVDTSLIAAEAKRLFTETAFGLPQPVLADLRGALGREGFPRARAMLETLLANAEAAARDRVPLCQDTGLPQALVEIGEGARLTGEPLARALGRSAREAYLEAGLRRSAADPLTRENLGENIPLSLEISPAPGEAVRIRTLAKGGGCDNKSALFNLSPSSGPSDVLAAVLESLRLAGPDSCPPWYVGVCVGGSFESAPRWARRALWDMFAEEGADPREDDLSREYLEAVNKSGFGPMFFGGGASALGLRVKVRPCHIASLPVAINLSCHSFRVGESVI